MNEVLNTQSREFIYSSEEERGQHILTMLKDGWAVGDQIKEELSRFSIKSRHRVWYAHFTKEVRPDPNNLEFLEQLYELELYLHKLGEKVRMATGWMEALQLATNLNVLNGMSIEEATAFCHLYKADAERRSDEKLINIFNNLRSRGKLEQRVDTWYTLGDINHEFGIGEFK